MSIDPDFADLMTDTVTVAPATAKDGYGKRTVGTAVTITGRLVGETTKRLDGTGIEIVDTGRFICFGAYPDISTEDILTLPDGSEAAITAIDTPRDVGGDYHHTVIRFGR